MQNRKTDGSEEQELLVKLKKGDAQAFQQLFNQYWRLLYTLAYHRLGDESEAKDMVQEIFAAVWARHATLQIDSTLEGYLRTALKNRIIKAAIKRNLHQNAISHLLSRMDSMENIILDSIAAGELKKTIDQIVHTFPNNMKKVFLLRLEDHTVAEIAKALGLAEQTVKNNYTEALKRLKDTLQKNNPELYQSLHIILFLFIKD